MKIRLINIVVVLLIFTSCTPEIIDNKDKTTSIELTADKLEIVANYKDKIKLSVTDNNNNDLSLKAKLYANSTTLQGPIFMSLDPDEYEIFAEYEGLTSNTITISAIEAPVLSIMIMANKKEAYADESDSVRLTVYTDNALDITDQATIYADDEAISGFYFKSNNIGEVTFKATFESFTSTTNVTFKERPNFTQRVLVEDYTGTWCGYCPRVAYALEEAMDKNENIVAMAIHSGDAMEYEHVGSMTQKFGVEGFPTAIINRTSKWNESYNTIATYTGNAAPIALEIKSSISDDKANVKVKVKTISWFDSPLKLILCLTEDKLIYSQRNFYNDGKGDPITNFEHNHVLRKAYTDIYGDELTGKNNENIYEKNFNISLNSKYKKENCHLIAIAVNKNNNRVVNVQKVKLGESVEY